MPRSPFKSGGKGMTILTVAMIMVVITAGLYYISAGTFWGFNPFGIFGVQTGDQVVVTGYVYEEGGAHAVVASSAVYIFDQDMNFIEAPQTSAAGLFTLSSMRYEGSKLYLQVRQAAPGSADPYLGPLEERIVPGGDQADTVTLDPIFVWDATETAPTQAFADQGATAISDNTNYFINTTDTAVTLYLSAIDSDTSWGPDYQQVTDYSSDTKDKWSGPLFVWKGTASQTWATTPDFVVSDPTNVYYIWKIPQLVDSSASTSDDQIAFTIKPVSAFVADATVVLDCYDTIKLDNQGNVVIGNISDGPGGGPTSAVTTKVA